MAKFKNLIGRNQIADAAISLVELDVALQNEITQITTNKNNIQAIIDSKGAANGLATLGADGKLSASQIPQITISDFLGEVSSEAGLLALTGQRGDWAIRTDNKTSYMLIAENATLAASWKAIVTPDDGVTALRNTSGTQTGLNGVVTLADVAFSGSANDVSFADASYTATTVKGALVEVMGKVSDVEADVATLETAMSGKLALAGFSPYVELTGTINGTNDTFTSPVDLTGAKVVAMMGGQIIHGTEFSIAGNNVKFNAEPTYEYQRPALMVFKAA